MKPKGLRTKLGAMLFPQKAAPQSSVSTSSDEMVIVVLGNDVTQFFQLVDVVPPWRGTVQWARNRE
jgi:hypothetical protein